MKNVKKTGGRIMLILILAAVLESCTAQHWACQTYSGHYSNLYASYKKPKHRR